MLHALGIIDAPSSAHFTFATRTGVVVERDLSPSTETLVERPGALYLRDRTTPYRYDYLAGTRTLYVQYNACREIAGFPFATFLNELATFAQSHPIDRFVLDMRHNSGGDSRVLQPLISALQSPPIDTFVFIGRRTISSALINAIELDQRTNAIFVGEPTGGKPNSYGEVRSFVLPATRLTVTYSTKYFELLPVEDPPSFAPDLHVPISSDDYFGGIDPLLTSILPRGVRRRAAP